MFYLIRCTNDNFKSDFPVITTILHAPTWVVFGILGVLLYWLGQKRKPVEVFIN